MKRLWTLGIFPVVTAFVVAACSGGDNPALTPTLAGAPASAIDSTPAPAQDPQPSTRSVPTLDPSPTATAGQPSETDSFSSSAAAKYDWEVVTVDDNGAKPSLALDPEGTPHLAYMLEAMPGFVKHAVLESNSWSISTVSTGYFYGPLDIQVDDKGVPHISWHNHDAEDEAYAALDSGNWVVRNIKHPGHDGWDNNLAIDSQGRPHTVSIDPSQFGSRSGVEYATLSGEAWTVEEVGSGPVLYEFGTGIVLDSQDRPHVVWFDDSNEDLKLAVKDGGVWNISTVDSAGDVGRYPFLVVDKQGNPSISYFERMSQSTGYVKIARWDGSEWNSQRIGKLENVFPGFFGARKNSSLVFDKDNNPIVAYSDEQVIKLSWWDGSGWNFETVLTAVDLPLGQQVSLALDNSGVLHLTFADVTSKGSPGVKGTVKYARGTPTADSVDVRGDGAEASLSAETKSAGEERAVDGPLKRSGTSRLR